MIICDGRLLKLELSGLTGSNFDGNMFPEIYVLSTFNVKINASVRAVPVYRKHLGRAEVWNIFRNNFEEYATTNETDFMGSVTMSPASGRQLGQR